PVLLTINDQHSNTNNALAQVVVSNVAPVITSLTPATSTINENGVTTLTGTITDVGTLDTFTLSVNWGDGNVQSVTNLGSGQFTVTHRYLDNIPKGLVSNFTVSATVTDDDGGVSNTPTVAVTVNNVAPTVSALAVTPGSVNENGVTTLSGTIGDVGTLDTFT